MKLIEIQRHYFTVKGDKHRYYCVKAETDMSLNVKVIHYTQADNIEGDKMVLRGNDIEKVVPERATLGIAYMPASDVRRLNTQTPDSMGYDIHEALKKLTEAVGGNVTDYVCERLQWSRAEIEERLFAEQVDAVALAIYNHEAIGQAMIIGDQTGIGKGRVASSMIRYAIVHGLIPVYCTENAGLFSDNYRDLVDIGCGDLKPFIINQSTSGQTDARIKVLNDNDEFVVVHTPITDKKQREKIFAGKELPKGFDYVLTTYSQLSSALKKTKDGDAPGSDFDKFEFLKRLAPKAFFIFDESHNISGSKAVVTKWWEANAEVELGGSNQFYCFNTLSKLASGVVFLSATFAKRPENLVVYANRTCISESGLKDTELIQAIQDGGEALQEVISSDIVHEGQMIRRESIYEGIEVNYIYLDKSGHEQFGTPDLERQHRAICDYITGIINLINQFEKDYINPIIDQMAAKSAMFNMDTSKTSKNLGVSHDPIFSKLFMIVNQMLFSIKAEAVADHAVRRLMEGKKVVIGLSSTMESFLDEFIEDDGEINCDFTAVLDRALRSTLKFRTRDMEGGGASEFAYIDVSSLSPDGQDLYFKIRNEIKKGSSGISLSPIDLITQKIEAAGFKVSEVTGRKRKIVFSNDQGTRGSIVPRKYVTRNVAFGQFQNNQSDVLIINASGATGASAHATTKNTNLTPDQVKPRVMIIAQMELDVNKEVQKRGRINRTGQIKELPPSYDYLISAIPAEKRLMMMMQKKLKSLDANSTSNQKQSTGIIDTSDFMNKYGDEVCRDYLLENPIINDKLNNPIGDEGEKEVSIHKVTGHVPVLTCEEQDKFYTNIQAMYDDKVHSLIEKGEYDLEVEAMDLDAEQIGDLRLLVSATAGESKFSDAAYVGTYDCKVLRKPYSEDEIRVMLATYMGGSYKKEEAVAKADKMAADMKEYYTAQIEQVIKTQDEKCEKNIKDAIERVVNKGGVPSDADADIAIIKEKCETTKRKNKERLNVEMYKARILKFFYAGRACILDSSNTKAICLGVKIGSTTVNPYAPSNLKVSFAVASSMKILESTLVEEGYKTLSEIMVYSKNIDSYYVDIDAKYLNEWHDYIKESVANREVRQIIVGNTLRAYKQKPEGAKLISFTTHEGEVLKGLLVPKDNKAKEGGGEKIVLSRYSIKKFLPFIKKDLADGEKKRYDMNRGTYLLVNGNKSSYAIDEPIAFCVQNGQTYKALLKNKNEDLKALSSNGRGFSEWGSGSGKWYVLNVHPSQLNDLVDFLDSMTFGVELLPSQVAAYFPDDGKNKMKNGNWKKVQVNKANIPTSQPKKTDDDKARKLRLAKAKAKALLLYAYAQKNKF